MTFAIHSFQKRVDELLGRFDVGTQGAGTFRYCAKQFTAANEGIAIDVAEGSRKTKPIKPDSGRPNSDPLKLHEMNQPRSTAGYLSRVARQARPDLLLLASRLRSELKDATISGKLHLRSTRV